MANAKHKTLFLSLGSCLLQLSQAQDVCEKMNYRCEEGHCCGRGHCCTYYYELWWFWFVWLAIAVTGICCFYQKKVRRRACLNRLFNLNMVECDILDSSDNAAAETNTMATQTSLSADKVFNLPSYEELRDLTKDPPSYAQIYQAAREDVVLPLPPDVAFDGNTGTNTGMDVSLPPVTDPPPQYDSSGGATVVVTVTDPAQSSDIPEEPSLADNSEQIPAELDNSMKAQLLENEEQMDTMEI